jgi:sec-independent protein translocase protein TatA
MEIHLLLFMGLGGTEIFLIAGIVLLLFGGKKLPELMRGLGKGIREFKEAKDDREKAVEEKKIPEYDHEQDVKLQKQG